MNDDQMKPGVALLAKALTPQPVAPDLSSRLTQSRNPVSLTLAGHTATFTMGAYHHVQDAITLPLRLGDQAARLELPPDLLAWALNTQDLPQPHDPDQLAMLLEFACQDLAEICEATLEQPFRAGGMPGHTPLSVGIDLEVEGQHHKLCLHLDMELANRLVNHLDRQAPMAQPNDLMLTQVPVILRIGQQFLTRDALATLQPGDIVMLEPGPPLLIAGRKVAAAIHIRSDGPAFQSDLLPLPQPEIGTDTRLSFIAAHSQMTLAELDALVPGAILPIAAFDGAALDIHADDSLLGRGETVTLGAGTGVRILQLFADNQ